MLRRIFSQMLQGSDLCDVKNLFMDLRDGRILYQLCQFIFCRELPQLPKECPAWKTLEIILQYLKKKVSRYFIAQFISNLLLNVE